MYRSRFENDSFEEATSRYNAPEYDDRINREKVFLLAVRFVDKPSSEGKLEPSYSMRPF